jgi:hypothetical protein
MEPNDQEKRLRAALETPRPAKDINYWVNCVGEGWRPLVRGLDANLRDIDSNYVIEQVKEKFGGLRFYVNSPPEDEDSFADFYKLIQDAEELSFRICETCGTAGKGCKPNKYSIRTLCPLCYRRFATKHASEDDD